MSLFFFFNDTATTEIYTLSLHDALPIFIQIHDRDRAQDEAPDGRFDGVWVPGTHRRPSLRVTPSEPTRVGRSPCFAQKSSQAVWRWVSSLMSKPPGASLGKARSNSNTMFS